MPNDWMAVSYCPRDDCDGTTASVDIVHNDKGLISALIFTCDECGEIYMENYNRFGGIDEKEI